MAPLALTQHFCLNFSLRRNRGKRKKNARPEIEAFSFRSNLKRPLTCSRVFFFCLIFWQGGLNACLKVAGRCVAQRHSVATLSLEPTRFCPSGYGFTLPLQFSSREKKANHSMKQRTQSACGKGREKCRRFELVSRFYCILSRN